MHEAVLQLRPYTHPRMPIAIVTGRQPGVPRPHREAWPAMAGWRRRRSLRRIVGTDRRCGRVGQAAPRIDTTRRSRSTCMSLPTRKEAIEQVREGTARERFDFASPIGAQPIPDVDRNDWVDHFAALPHVCIGSPDDAVAFPHRDPGTHRCRRGTDLLQGMGRPTTARRDSFELIARYVMPHMQGSLVGLQAAETVATKTAPLVQ